MAQVEPRSYTPNKMKGDFRVLIQKADGSTWKEVWIPLQMGPIKAKLHTWLRSIPEKNWTPYYPAKHGRVFRFQTNIPGITIPNNKRKWKAATADHIFVVENSEVWIAEPSLEYEGSEPEKIAGLTPVMWKEILHRYNPRERQELKKRIPGLSSLSIPSVMSNTITELLIILNN